ncbi:unnamed protein product [Somion occarium]|uniref:rRNA processing protein EBP2 n=1 Tax=Somion occarium TaxID=3059160 RepID=A0ABP1DYT7_9APHY
MAKKATLASSKAKASSLQPQAKSQKSPKVVQRPQESSEDDVEDEESVGSQEHEEDSSDDEEDVDEEGMKKLMVALGEDGLDEFAQTELRALTGDEDSDEEESDAEEGSEIAEEDVDEVDAQQSGDEDEEVQEGASEDEDEERAVESERDEDEEEQDIPLDEAESVDEDVVPRQKIEIDNKIALARIRETIQLDPSMPWTETLTVTYPESIEVDVDDDLNRELAFYKQALHGANTAKDLAAKHNFPFTRPADYFAEMVKSDAHMERIRQRLLDEGATIKRSEEKRREREGKKFGKQVQMEKLKERERSKKDMEERLKGLKRKRKGAMDNAQEDEGAFDVAVEDAISDRPSKRGRGGGRGDKRGISRPARDKKFGFGGPGKRAKQNTKDSTDDFVSRGSGRSSRGGRGGARGGSKRLGKSRRMTSRGRS